jgi:hypothetical protein
MKYVKSLFTLAAAGFLLTTSARAGDVKVIANNSVAISSISADDLIGVFLMTKSTLGGGHVEPVVEQGGPAHEGFLKEYIHKTAQALQNYYRSQLLAGTGSMPKILASDAAVVEYVAKTKGAIGYVAAGASAAGVKTLEVK